MSLTDIDNAEDVIRKGIIDLQKPQPFFCSSCDAFASRIDE